MLSVSIIVPCFNEQDTIGLLLEAVYCQSFGIDKIEVVIADGMSTDGTRDEINRFQREHPALRIRIVNNLDRHIPAGLNRAIEASAGIYIVRLDAHSIPAEDYVTLCIDALEEGQGDIIGGVWEIRPRGDGWVQSSIAFASSHYLGVGDALYRVGSPPKSVDTVPFGAFRLELIDQIGPYDEGLRSNEDYEFNTRLRESGGVVWLNPNIRSIYFARENYYTLSRQYWRYGYWKLRMLIRYPQTLRWRQLSGAFVLTWLVLGGTAIWFPIARWLLIIEALIYGSALTVAGIQIGLERRDCRMLFGVPIAIGTMHFSWGCGFLWSGMEFIINRILNRP